MSDPNLIDGDLDEEGNDPNVVDPNEVRGATAKEVLEYLLEKLVEDPEDISIDAYEQRDRIELRVTVGGDDMGRVIGRRGKTANAIRTIVGAAAARDGLRSDVEFDD